MSSSKLTVILSTSQQWDDWLFLILGRAERLHVRQLVDPSQTAKPQGLQEPERPTLSESDPTEIQIRAYQAKRTVYKDNLSAYREQ